MERHITAKTFKTEAVMFAWLADQKNIEKLKKQYPPPRFYADVNLIDKVVIVTDKGEDNANQDK